MLRPFTMLKLFSSLKKKVVRETVIVGRPWAIKSGITFFRRARRLTHVLTRRACF
jgi:hypothetical protein